MVEHGICLRYSLSLSLSPVCVSLQLIHSIPPTHSVIQSDGDLEFCKTDHNYSVLFMIARKEFI